MKNKKSTLEELSIPRSEFPKDLFPIVGLFITADRLDKRSILSKVYRNHRLISESKNNEIGKGDFFYILGLGALNFGYIAGATALTYFSALQHFLNR